MCKYKRKSYFLIAIISIIIVLFTCVLASTFLAPNQVLALTNSGAATPVANGAELYDDASNKFNSLAVFDLKKKLFANNDPINYIKASKDNQTDSYVISASTINSSVGNINDGLVVTLGGYQWIVSALTLTDSTLSGKEDIVVTLYMADNSNVNSDFYPNSSAVKGNDAYSRSSLRENLLTNSSFAKFVGGSFATKYLVQPKYIKYQHTQSWTRFGTTNFYNLSNDALHHLSSGWQSQPLYVPSDMFTTPSGDNVSYDAWGNDYIWIPSITEVGGNYGTINLSGSIWDLSANQLSSNSTTWLRSGTNYNQALILQSNGVSSSSRVSEKNYVRPAIHLNLSEVIKGIVNELENPLDLTTTYNGKTQPFSDIVKQNSNTSWYDKTLYEQDNEYIKVTYPNSLKAFEDAGDYWIKVEIKEEWTNKIYAQVDDDAAKYGWTSDQTESVKQNRAPRFKGEPNTSDTSHLETSTIRWLKVTVNKADLDFSNVKWSADSLEYNALYQTVTIISGLPDFLTITYSGNTQTNVNENYTAKVVKITSSNNNYNIPTIAEINTIAELQHNWKITKKRITAEWDSKEETRDGITISIPILKIEESLTDCIEYKYYTDELCTKETTIDEIFAKYDVTKLNLYYVKAKLKSSGTDFNSTNSLLIINGAEVTETVDILQTGATSNSVMVTLVDSKVTFNGNGQTPTFNVSGGGLNAESLVLTYKTQAGVLLSTLPKSAGKYKIYVSLKDDIGDFVIVGQKEFDFEIESLKIAKPSEKQTKTFKADGFDFSSITNLPKDWANYFDIKVFDKDNNELDKVNGSWLFFGVNEYRIQISFKNGMNTNNGGQTDNVIWLDGTKANCQTTLEIQKLVLVVDGWQNAEDNGRATLISNYTQEIEKYFDYVICERNGDVVLGDELAGNATLKYETDYQIILRIKNEYKGNVVVSYNGENVEETAPYKFTTKENPFTDGNNNGGNKQDNFGEMLKKLPLYVWILIGVIAVLLILVVLLIVVMAVKRNKKSPPPQQAIPYEKYSTIKSETETAGDNITNTSNGSAKTNEVINVRGTIVNNYKVGYKDWTFVMKETDILNLEVLESPQDEIMFYAFKKNDLRKVKKLQSQIDLAANDESCGKNKDTLDNDFDKKDSKKGKGKKN